jgi:hypothetical protein
MSYNEGPHTPATGATGVNDTVHFNRNTLAIFKDDAGDSIDEHKYRDVADPRKRASEVDATANPLLRAVQYVTRGRSIPYKTLLGMVLWSAFVVGMGKLTSKNWSGENDKTCMFARARALFLSLSLSLSLHFPAGLASTTNVCTYHSLWPILPCCRRQRPLFLYSACHQLNRGWICRICSVPAAGFPCERGLWPLHARCSTLE